MKTIFTRILLLAALVFGATQIWAQDPLLAQYFNAPVRLNPAMTGVFNGSYRVGVNYRDQWSSVVGGDNAFRTYAVGADMNTFVMKNDFAGLGIYMLRDQAGSGKYTHTNVMLSGAYLKQLSGRGRGWQQAEHFLSGGLQVGFGQNTLDWAAYRFGNQFNGQEYQSTLSSGENAADSKFYVDVNAGLMWYAIFGDHLSVHAGGSASHVNQPAIGFFSKPEPLYMRFTGEIGAEIPLTKQFSLLPGILVWKQGPAMQPQVGTNIRYSNKDWHEVALKAGIWSRLPGDIKAPVVQESLIFYIGGDFENTSLGISYDLNQSTLRNVSNARGAYELSLIYTHPPKRRLGVNCPRFR
jgi:type IX secretion system PorP/SprF family membrane protein